MAYQIFNDNCFIVMQDLQDEYCGKIDLIVTDPPFGIGIQEWDKKRCDLSAFWQATKGLAKRNAVWAVCCQQPFETDLISSNRNNFKYELIWKTCRYVQFANCKKMPLRSHQNIAVFYACKPTYNPQMTHGKTYQRIHKEGKVSCTHSMIRSAGIVNYDGQRYPTTLIADLTYSDLVGTPEKRGYQSHPTQKPVSLMEWLIKTYSNPGDTVLDPFMGCGTTGVAAINTGRNFIGMEKDPNYYDAALYRLEHAEKAQQNPHE